MKKALKYNRVTTRQIIKKALRNELTLLAEQNVFTRYGKTLIETYVDKRNNYYHLVFIEKNGDFDLLASFQSKSSIFTSLYIDDIYLVLKFHHYNIEDIWYFNSYKNEVLIRTYEL